MNKNKIFLIFIFFGFSCKNLNTKNLRFDNKKTYHKTSFYSRVKYCTALLGLSSFGVAGDQSRHLLSNNSIYQIWQNGSDILYGYGLGSEIQVNTNITNDQSDGVVLPLGNNFIVTWSSLGQDGDRNGVYMQMFDQYCNKLDEEKQVNTNYIDEQKNPKIVYLSQGNFMIIWQAYSNPLGTAWDIIGQVFNSSGYKVGGEQRINGYSSGYQELPQADNLNDGIVVVWQSFGQDGSGNGIAQRKFSFLGNVLINDVIVNTNITGNQNNPYIKKISEDKFVVTWESFGQDGSELGVYAQIFYNNFTRIGQEFLVNTETNLTQSNARIARLRNKFIIVWNSNGPSSVEEDVFGQFFDLDGNKIGNEFRINSYTDNSQSNPHIVGLPNGYFIVAWNSYNQDSNLSEVYCSIFDGNGQIIGNEFRVNSYINDQQFISDIKILNDGRIIIVWSSKVLDGSGFGVFFDLFEFVSPTGAPTISPSKFPTVIPSKKPSFNPTNIPTIYPTITSLNPSINPTKFPSDYPSISPSNFPTIDPTLYPSFLPTSFPTNAPIINPTINPTLYPSYFPSSFPTSAPTINPTINPSKLPSTFPTVLTTIHPSRHPTKTPSISHTKSPTNYSNITNINSNSNSNFWNSISGVVVILISSVVVLILLVVCLVYCVSHYIKKRKFLNMLDEYIEKNPSMNFNEMRDEAYNRNDDIFSKIGEKDFNKKNKKFKDKLVYDILSHPEESFLDFAERNKGRVLRNVDQDLYNKYKPNKYSTNFKSINSSSSKNFSNKVITRKNTDERLGEVDSNDDLEMIDVDSDYPVPEIIEKVKTLKDPDPEDLKAEIYPEAETVYTTPSPKGEVYEYDL